MDEVNKRIKSRLALKGMTQGNLADLLGVTEKTVSLKLTGRSSWKDCELMTIADRLEVSVGWILEGDNGEV